MQIDTLASKKWTNADIASLAGAVLLQSQGYIDSSASRAYYAAYAAVHALSFSVGILIDGRHAPNNWEHTRVTQVFWQASAKVGLDPYQRDIMKKYLETCQRHRVLADYVPGSLDKQSGLGSVQAATAVVRFVEGRLQ